MENMATKVCVLGGGTSSEREISLRSAKAVVAALTAGGYTAKHTDPAEFSEQELSARLEGYDVVFPVLHGAGGEDGVLQAWLETRGVAYVGANSTVSALCFDKNKFKQALASLGIQTPTGELVGADTMWQSEITRRPYVLKPNDGGSSVDTFIVRNPELADKPAINAALQKHPSMLLEELIDGQEITVGVVGNEALPVIEIIPPADGEFDYENKYNGQTRELCPPQNISEGLQRKARELALRIHTELGIADLSRTDFIIRADDNTLSVLETNTLPGMTNESLLPKAAAVAGYGMPKLCSMLVTAASARGTLQTKLHPKIVGA